MKLLNRAVGITQIVVGVFHFDPSDTNQVIVSFLLLLGGVLFLLVDSESALLRSVHRVLCYVGFVVALGLIFKVMFGS